jgi:hypothetical protein
MKGVAIVAVLASVLLGGLWLRQIQKTTQAEASLAALQQKAAGTEADLDRMSKQLAGMQTRLNDSRKEPAFETPVADTKVPPTNSVPSVSAQETAAPTNAKSSNPFAMLGSAQMKKMLQSQKGMLGTVLDKNYARLFSDLKLSPEQSAAVKEVLMDRMMNQSQLGLSAFSDDMDSEKRAQLQQQIKAESDKTDARLKELLGADGYTQFESYEKSYPERTVVSSFKDQMQGNPSALSPAQEDQLLQAMTEERSNFKFTNDLTDKSKFDGDLSSLFTEENINRFSDEQAKLNQQYLSRAQGILAADQVVQFQQFLNSQQEMQKLGMQMAQKMFPPKGPGK